MPRAGRQVSRKAKTSSDVSTTNMWQVVDQNKSNNRKYSNDQDDIASRATTASDSGSEKDYLPSTPPKTSLKSLKNKATPFVPSDDLGPADMPMMPACLPTPGKDCLAGIIQNTLGGEVWNLNMMDGMSYTGEWYTAVEITIPELSASMCYLGASGDAHAVAAAQESQKAQAIQSLTQGLQVPGMTIQPFEQGVQLCAEFCMAPRDQLCREFSHFGGCPRGATCRWQHAVIEVFMINFVLAPLGQWGESIEACSGERWQPSRPPMPPRQERSSVDESNNEAESVDAKATPSKLDNIKPLAPETRPRNLSLTSPKRWCDIEDDSDDDLDCRPFAQTL